MSLINIAVTGIRVAQTSLATTGHNISNANTEGYTRQRAEQTSQKPNFTGSGFIGNGAITTAVTRLYNEFINEELRVAGGELAQSSAYLDQALQLDSLLASSNTSLTTSLERFFGSLSTAAEDPQSVATRQLVLSESEGLADRYNILYQEISGQNDFINDQVEALVSEINQLAASISNVNEAIAASFSNGRQPNDLIDQRDQAVRELSELIGVTASPRDDGTVDLFIGSGQPLLVGSDLTTLTVEPSLDAAFKLAIVQEGAGTDITSVATGGQIGGLLAIQDELIIPALNDLGLMAIVTADAINQQQSQGLDLNGEFGVNLFSDINSAAAMSNRVVGDPENSGDALLVVEITDAAVLTANDYVLSMADNQYRLLRADDSAIMATGFLPLPGTISLPNEGIDIHLTGGAGQEGDQFFISPTRLAAGEIEAVLNEPSQLAFSAPIKSTLSSDNRGEVNTFDLAITSELTSSNNALVTSSGAMPFDLIYNETAQAWEVANAPIGYNILPLQNPITPGVNNTVEITINDLFGNSVDISIGVSGTAQDGDAISLAANDGGVADNQNILKMIELQTADLIRSSTAVASANQSLVDSYSQVVELVGVVTAQKQIEFEANTNIYDQAFSNREEISGVNIDEEAANLLRFEQAYNAAAQVIATARELFDRILSI